METVCKDKADFSNRQIFAGLFSRRLPDRLAFKGVPFRKRVQRYGFIPDLQAMREFF
jgi:hypothetical protein